MYTLQIVTNLLKKINDSIHTYVLCLLLTSGKKNCSEMARTVGIQTEPLYEFLKNAEENTKIIEKYLFEFAKATRDKNIKRTLVIDPTTIIKRYAEKIDNLCYDRSGCTKHIEKGLVPIYASVVDKNVKIPLSIRFWTQEKVIGEKKYKSKIKITCELISYLITNKVDFDFVSLDGAFPFPDMFTFFDQNPVGFIMRISSSRCVITNDGKRMQLKYVPDLKLKRNSREKTIQAKLYNKTYFFTAQKIKKKGGGWETIFLVSNMDLTAKEHGKAYKLRWPQEKINRTSKQKFGIDQCQVVEAEKQKAHIMAGYLAHTIIEIAKNDESKQSVDEIVNFIRRQHFNDLASLVVKNKKSNSGIKIDLDIKTFQNHVQNFSNNIGVFNVFSP